MGLVFTLPYPMFRCCELALLNPGEVGTFTAIYEFLLTPVVDALRTQLEVAGDLRDWPDLSNQIKDFAAELFVISTYEGVSASAEPLPKFQQPTPKTPGHIKLQGASLRSNGRLRR